MSAVRSPAFFASCMSPTDLAMAAGVEDFAPAIACVLDAAGGCPPTLAQRGTWKRLGASRWPVRKPRTVVCCLGRRSRKTSNIVAWSAIHALLCGDYDRFALPGSRIYAVIICPKLEHAREAVRGCKAALEALAPIGVTFETRDLAGNQSS